MSKKTQILTIIAFIISISIITIDFVIKENTPKEVYRVYSKGESIGLIGSKQELEKIIDKEQELIKRKYQVDKVFIPNDIDIVKEITYNSKTSTAQSIYNKIKESSPFTINGYKIIIKGTEETTEGGEVSKKDDIVLYTTEKEIFVKSIKKMAYAFINKEELDLYEQDRQQQIVDVGKTIENVYIKNERIITKENIPVNEKIYTSEEELSKQLLFGTTVDQTKYAVKAGDTINDVAFDNKISPEEFLVANPNFKTTNELLYPGQTVILGILKPQIEIVEEVNKVERINVDYEIKYENDANQYVGYELVKQEGKNGVKVVTQKIKNINGETKEIETLATKEEVPTIEKIIIRGTKQRISTGPIGGSDYDLEVPVEIGTWVWPTANPYTITSPYGYRWGKFHQGIDISGPGAGSAIKAANNGIVVLSKYDGMNGNHIYIKHSNGYISEYAHMNARYKKVGDVVYAGDVIGTMGNTGYSFGAHLHFGLWRGIPFRTSPMNPLSVLKR